MSTKNLSVTEHLYDVTAQITNIIEYGVSMQELLTDPSKMPPEGARIDVKFEGKVTGSKINGTVKGTDYLYMRPDGYTRLHIHVCVITDDGENISLFGEGISKPTDNPDIFNLSENVTLLTAVQKYAWVNQLNIWAKGSVELSKGEIKVSGYLA